MQLISRPFEGHCQQHTVNFVTTNSAAFGCFLILSSVSNCSKLLLNQDTAGNNSIHLICLRTISEEKSSQGRSQKQKCSCWTLITNISPPSPLLFLRLHHNHGTTQRCGPSWTVPWTCLEQKQPKPRGSDLILLPVLPVFKAQAMHLTYFSVEDLIEVCPRVANSL